MNFHAKREKEMKCRITQIRKIQNRRLILETKNLVKGSMPLCSRNDSETNNAQIQLKGKCVSGRMCLRLHKQGEKLRPYRNTNERTTWFARSIPNPYYTSNSSSITSGQFRLPSCHPSHPQNPTLQLVCFVNPYLPFFHFSLF